MKATNINQTEIKDHIKGKKCDKCKQKFTDEELKDNNYSVWFDNDNDEINLTRIESGHRLEINIARITHEWDEKYPTVYDCPSVETCHDCGGTHRATETEKGIGEDEKDNNYCKTCYQRKYGDYLEARGKRKMLSEEQKEVLRIVNKAWSEHLASNFHHGKVDYSNCKGSECEGYKQILESYGYSR